MLHTPKSEWCGVEECGWSEGDVVFILFVDLMR